MKIIGFIEDDEASVLAVGKRILEKLGYAVMAAGGAGGAIEMVRGHAGAISIC